MAHRKYQFIALASVAGIGILILVAVVAARWPQVNHAREAGSDASSHQVANEERQRIARRGQAIVLAIYRFKQERGLWPHTLDSLPSDYLDVEKARIDEWRLSWRPSGWWQLIHYGGYPNYAVAYGFGGNDKGWVVTDGIYASPLGVEQPMPPAQELSAAVVRKNQIEEFQRRIAAEPSRIIHYQGLTALHYKHQEWQAARGVCQQSYDRWPDHWWNNMMLAFVDVKHGKVDEAEARLRKWLAMHKDFTHQYFLADFLHFTGQREAAKTALEEANTSPFKVVHACLEAGENFGIGLDYYCWNAAMLAYQEGWHDTAFAICDRWERFNEERGYGDPGYLAVRAACYLVQGKYDEAAKQMDAIRKHKNGSGHTNYGWNMDKNLLPFEKAIKAKDKLFRYDPGDRAEPVPLLIDYQ